MSVGMLNAEQVVLKSLEKNVNEVLDRFGRSRDLSGLTNIRPFILGDGKGNYVGLAITAKRGSRKVVGASILSSIDDKIFDMTVGVEKAVGRLIKSGSWRPDKYDGKRKNRDPNVVLVLKHFKEYLGNGGKKKKKPAKTKANGAGH